jgi:hypothetical protein
MQRLRPLRPQKIEFVVPQLRPCALDHRRKEENEAGDRRQEGVKDGRTGQ